MKKSNLNFGNAFYNNRFVFIFSIICAVIVWLIVTVQFGDEKDQVITGVPVTVDYANIKSKYGLVPFGDTNFTVNVTVRGKRYIVENSEVKNDLIVTANTSQITSAGTYSLRLEVETADETPEYEIVSSSLDAVEVYFDVNQEKEFNLEIVVDGEYKNSIAPEGYFVGEPTLSETSVVKVSGPETQMRKVTGVTATVKVDKQLTDTAVLDAELSVISDQVTNYVRTDRPGGIVPVTFAVYKIAEMPVEVSFTNKPAKYVSNIPFDIKISPNVSTFAIRESKLADMDVVEILTVDFSQLHSGTNTFTVTADELTDIVLLDSSTVFNVSVTLKDFATSSHSIVLGNSSLENVPQDAQVSLVTTALNSVTVVGPQESLAQINAGSFGVSVDMTDVDLTPGRKQVPAKVYLIDSEDCWVFGEYNVMVEIK